MRAILISMTIVVSASFGYISATIANRPSDTEKYLENSQSPDLDKQRKLGPPYFIPGEPVKRYVYHERDGSIPTFTQDEIYRIARKINGADWSGKKIRVVGHVIGCTVTANSYAIDFLHQGDHWPDRPMDRLPNDLHVVELPTSVVASIGNKRSVAARIRKFDYVEVCCTFGKVSSYSSSVGSYRVQLDNGIVERHLSMFGHGPDPID